MERKTWQVGTEEPNWRCIERLGVGGGVGDEGSVRGLRGEGKGSKVVSLGHSKGSKGQNDS